MRSCRPTARGNSSHSTAPAFAWVCSQMAQGPLLPRAGTMSCAGAAGGPISTGDLPDATGVRNAAGVLTSSSGGITGPFVSGRQRSRRPSARDAGVRVCRRWRRRHSAPRDRPRSRAWRAAFVRQRRYRHGVQQRGQLSRRQQRRRRGRSGFSGAAVHDGTSTIVAQHGERAQQRSESDPRLLHVGSAIPRTSITLAPTPIPASMDRPSPESPPPDICTSFSAAAIRPTSSDWVRSPTT